MNTSWDCASLIRVCMEFKNDKTACNPKINSKSQSRLKFLVVVLFLDASTCVFAINGQYYSMTHFMRDNILIHLIFTFLSNLFPFSMNTSHNFWNSRKILGEWEKKNYMACNSTSNQVTKLSFNSTNTTKFVKWAKQWTLIMNVTTIFFIWMVPPTLLPSQPMEMSFNPKSLTLAPAKESKDQNISWKTLLVVPYTSTFSTQTKRMIWFQPWIT